MAAAPATRYSAVAILLHWTIATAILVNIAIGWWMHRAIDGVETAARAAVAYQVHKSIGLTVLALSLLRLGWRLFNPPPPLPAAMPGWEKAAARITHWLFYALMLALPLSGWLYVSAQWRGDGPFVVATRYFDLFGVPHLFGLAEAPDAIRRSTAGAAIQVHELLVWTMVALLLLHIGAALKHHLVSRDAVLATMVPGLTPPDGSVARGSAVRTAALGAGFAIVLAGLAMAVAPIFSPPSATVPTPRPTAAAGGPPVPETTIPPGSAAIWTVERGASAIEFSGTHAGAPFRGRFDRWSAGIRFDPADLAGSRVAVTVDTASAADGFPLHDSNMPGREWFNVAEFPVARFEADRFRRVGDHYEAQGTLTLKGKPHRISLPFSLSVDGARATMSGQVCIARRDADLGMSSDPDAKYVSPDILVAIRVTAQRQGAPVPAAAPAAAVKLAALPCRTG